ncbi:MAG: hypothetical protein PVJ30_03385 [Thiohalocapsa sp.]|jgi:hypothetical protein
MALPTIDEIIKAAESREDVGFCVACGAMAKDIEPDARGYPCENCGRLAVYGAEELLLCDCEPLDDGTDDELEAG